MHVKIENPDTSLRLLDSTVHTYCTHHHKHTIITGRSEQYYIFTFTRTYYAHAQSEPTLTADLLVKQN